MKRVVVPALFVGIVALSGCAFEDPCGSLTCVESDAGGEINAQNAGTADAGEQNGTTSNGNPTDAGAGSNNGSANSGNSSVPDAGMDAGIDAGTVPPNNSQPNATSPPSCQVDVFEFACTDDPYEVNDRPLAGHFVDAVGCGLDGQRLERFDHLLEPRVCPLESADYFYVNFAPCDGEVVTLEVEFDSLTSCPSDLYSVDFAAPCTAEPGVTCDRDGNRLTVTHDGTGPGSTVFTVRFGIVTTDDVFIDYRLRVRGD